jgi:hypothetical protein
MNEGADTLGRRRSGDLALDRGPVPGPNCSGYLGVRQRSDFAASEVKSFSIARPIASPICK